jgi:hypothetical protein
MDKIHCIIMMIFTQSLYLTHPRHLRVVAENVALGVPATLSGAAALRVATRLQQWLQGGPWPGTDAERRRNNG